MSNHEKLYAVRGKIVYAGATTKTIDPGAPYGDISNPIASIQEAFDAGAVGVIVFSETNADDWRLVTQTEMSPAERRALSDGFRNTLSIMRQRLDNLMPQDGGYI